MTNNKNMNTYCLKTHSVHGDIKIYLEINKHSIVITYVGF